MGQRADNKLEGEDELFELMRERWYYGATLDQLDAAFDHKGRRPVGTPQLLEFMVADGRVYEKDGLYFTKREPVGEQLEAISLTEYKFSCADRHEFSVLSRALVKDDMPCAVLECKSDAYIRN